MKAQERFPEVFALVDKAHEGVHGGHDIYHVTRVAHFAQMIALSEWEDKRTAELAILAAFCHNADRLLEKSEKNLTRDMANVAVMVEVVVNEWLAGSDCTTEEKALVVNAVLVHSGRNDPNHSKVALALRDADRVVNLELDLIIRSGQHYHDLPAVDYVNYLGDPEANYRNPKSVLKDISLSLEWVDPTSPFCLQTKTGMQLGKERAGALQWYFDTLGEQLKKSGLLA